MTAAIQPGERPVPFQGDLRNLPDALTPLKALPNWVCWSWRWVVNKQGVGKWDKPPFQPRNPNQYARNNDPSTWGTFEQALAAFDTGKCDGIGFNLSGTDIAAFDVDKCRDKQSGVIAKEATALVDRAASYTEMTVSGTGLRIIGFGAGSKVHRKQNLPGSAVEVETYRGCERYIVVTGNPLPGAWPHMADITNEIDSVVAELDGKPVDDNVLTFKQRASAQKDDGFLPRDLVDLIERGPALHDDLSRAFHHAVCWLHDCGWSPSRIETYITGKPIVPTRYNARLAGEIARCIGRAKPNSSKASDYSADYDYKGDAKPDGREPVCIYASPYTWNDPAKIPARDWLYGRLLIRKFLSITAAPGGVGKTSLTIVEALAMVSGKDLLGITPHRKLRVWLWNLEDPKEETDRKIQAAAIHYKLSADDIGDRLFVDSGREQRLVIAQTHPRTGTTIVKPVVDSLVAEIKARGIDVVKVDPYISSHEVPENDNTGQDMVAKEWSRVADLANVSVELVHHVKKGEVEVTTESARGAKSLTDAARVVRVVNRMTKEQGEKAGVSNYRLYFRTYNDKANLAPPCEESDWHMLESVNLGNGPFGADGDSVGVVKSWKWPDPMDGVKGQDFDRVAFVIKNGKWRENPQAKDWVGKAVAEAMNMDASSPKDRAKIAGMIKHWRMHNNLVVVEEPDEKRMMKKFIQVADHVDD